MVRWLSKLVTWFSLNTTLRFARAVARVWYYCFPIRRRIARENVDRVFADELNEADRRRIVRASFENLTQFAIEGLRMPEVDLPLARERMRRLHFENYEKAMAGGRGVVAITAHLGNFDLMGCAEALKGLPIHVVYKDIAWRSAHDFWFGIRRSAGVTPIRPKGSERAILRALRKGELVAFVLDQHMPAHRGIVCEFFGQLASTTPAPALFALKTGATILPAVTYRDDALGHHTVYYDTPMELETPHSDLKDNVRHNTERFNRWLESWVKRKPEQWLWLHRRWKVEDNPDGWDIPADLRSRYEQRRMRANA